MVSATQTLRVSMGVRVHPSVSSLAVKKPLSLNFVKLRHTCETCRPDVSDKATAASTASRAVACCLSRLVQSHRFSARRRFVVRYSQRPDRAARESSFLWFKHKRFCSALIAVSKIFAEGDRRPCMRYSGCLDWLLASARPHFASAPGHLCRPLPVRACDFTPSTASLRASCAHLTAAALVGAGIRYDGQFLQQRHCEPTKLNSCRSHTWKLFC